MVTKDSIDNIDQQIEKLKNNDQTFEVDSNSPTVVVETIDKFEDTDTKVFKGNQELEEKIVSEQVLKNKNSDNLIIFVLIILIILVILFGFILIY